MNKGFTPPSKSPIKSLTKLKNIVSEKEHGFTLVELIIVIVIVGILAAVGINQYSLTVEKGRTAEAKKRIGVMRQLAYEYWLNNGTLTGLANSDVGVDYTCVSTDFYKYWVDSYANSVYLVANRCTWGGKTPTSSKGYRVFMEYYPGTGTGDWHCHYDDGSAACFGMPY